MARYIWISGHSAINPAYVVRASIEGTESNCHIVLRVKTAGPLLSEFIYKTFRGPKHQSQFPAAEKALKELVEKHLEDRN
jgi:hypothetical protein